MKRNGDLIAIYSRKSKFTGKGESIGNQVELCREYIRLHYGEKSVERIVVFEDEGFSGGNLNRPDFKRLMKEAKAHRLSVLVVYRLDRISRNISDFAALIEELGRLDISFVSIREQFDTGSPMGRAMMYIASVFSQLERETIAERIRDNMHELAKTGRWLGGVTPTGYTSESIKSVTIDGKTKKVCKLSVLPKEAEVIRLIYNLFIDTDSLTGTEAELLRRGVKTKNGKNYSRYTIKAILENPVYLIADQDSYQYFENRNVELFSPITDFDGVRGILAYNRTNQEKGRAAICNPVEEWIVSVGEHLGLIPSGQWIAAQRALERNKDKGYRKPRRNEALLTGMLYCRCGERMYPKLTKRKMPDGTSHYIYLCKMKERSKGSVCDLRNAHGNMLDEAVVEEIKKMTEDREVFLKQLERGKESCLKKQDGHESRMQELYRRRDELRKKIESLVDSLTEVTESAVRQHVAKRIEGMNREYEDVAEQIEGVERLTKKQILSDTEFGLLVRQLGDFRDTVDRMSVEQKRGLVRSVVHKVVWDGECAHIVLLGSPEVEHDGGEVSTVGDMKRGRRSDNESDGENCEKTPWRENSK